MIAVMIKINKLIIVCIYIYITTKVMSTVMTLLCWDGGTFC